MLFNDATPGDHARVEEIDALAFGAFTLDRARGVLLRDGEEVRLRPKSFEVLCCLVDHAGVLVSREELMQAIWPDVIVTGDSLSQCLIEIRRALGDGDREMIRTVPRRGYRFELPVLAQRAPAAPIPARPGRRLKSAGWWPGLAVLVLAAVLVARFGPAPQREAANGALESESFLQARALDHYRLGRFYHNRRAPGDMDRAVERFRSAVADDPGLADAWVGLAGALDVRNLDGGAHAADFPAGSIAYLQRALEIDPLHPEGNARMARCLVTLGDLGQARAYFDRALEHGGDDPIVLAMAAGQYHVIGEYSRAVDLQTRALQLDPLNAVNQNNLGHFLMADGRPAEARRALALALDLQPQGREDTVLGLAQAELLLGEHDAALLRIRDLPGSVGRDRILAMASQGLGRAAEAQAPIDRLAADPAIEAATALAEIHAFGAREDAAVARLAAISEQLFADGTGPRVQHVFKQIRHSPFLQRLGDHAGWQAWQAEGEALAWPGGHRLLAQSD